MLSEQGRTVDAELDGAVDDTVAALHLVDDDPVLEAQLLRPQYPFFRLGLSAVNDAKRRGAASADAPNSVSRYSSTAFESAGSGMRRLTCPILERIIISSAVLRVIPRLCI